MATTPPSTCVPARLATPTSSSATASTASCGSVGGSPWRRRPPHSGIETAPYADLAKALAGCARPHPGAARPGRRGSTRRWRRTTSRRPGPATRSWPRRISELKLVKDDWEIAQLRDAIAATVLGFEDVARVLPADRPVSERLVEGIFGLRARHDGNDVGYASIVGAGSHATILHWVRNDGPITTG